MKCSRCGNHVAEHGLEAARRQLAELTDLLGYLAGLLADFDAGIPDESRRMAHVCAKTMLGQVRGLGVKAKRVFTT